MDEQSIGEAVTMRRGSDSVLGRIDQYEFVRELGGGGFGTVYLARDSVSGIDVAVKGLPPFVRNNCEELENIRSNFALVSRLTHTNIAKALVLHPAMNVFYSSEDVRKKLRVDSGDMLMVMEYAPGVTLSQWRKQFPERIAPVDKALEIARQIASALDYAHGRRIVHRDVKPANVMIETAESGAITARVLDFGLAAEIRSSMGRISLEIHDTSGTRPYMAPEQWRGGRQGPATDQYALAVLFHELVTGEVPFAAVFETGDPVVMISVVGREPFSPQSNLPKQMRKALVKALAKNPEDRFSSCGEFVAALAGRENDSRGGAEIRGKGGLGKSVGLFALFAAVGVGGWWWYNVRQHEDAIAKPGRDEARPSHDCLDVVQHECSGKDGLCPVRNRGDLATASEYNGREREMSTVEQKVEIVQDAKGEANAQIGKTDERLANVKKDNDDPSQKAGNAAAIKEPNTARSAPEGQSASNHAQAKKEEREVTDDVERRANATQELQVNAKAEHRAEKEKVRNAEHGANDGSLKDHRRQRLYSDLALVETSLESFAQFEHQAAIQEKRDSLSASYKAARTAFDMDDLDNAVSMVETLKKPCEEIRKSLPVIRDYYSRKKQVDSARDDAEAVAADVYAKVDYSAAEQDYAVALEAEKQKDFARANGAISKLEERYKAIRESVLVSPEFLYRKGLAALKSNDHESAYNLFSKAADKKHPAALINVGLIHMKGLGVAKNDSAAFACFRKAALLGNARAQYLLGGCYAKAIGVKYDKELSRSWMLVAKVNGDKSAADFLSKAGWPVPVNDETAIREILATGYSDKSIPDALRQIAVECYNGK